MGLLIVLWTEPLSVLLVENNKKQKKKPKYLEVKDTIRIFAQNKIMADNSNMDLYKKTIDIQHPTSEMLDALNKLRDRKISQLQKLRSQDKCTVFIVL